MHNRQATQREQTDGGHEEMTEESPGARAFAPESRDHT